MQDKQLIKKHDSLQAMTRVFDSIGEFRLLHSCLIDIWQKEEVSDEKIYQLNIEDYAVKGGLTLGKAYSELKEQVLLLYGTSINYKDARSSWSMRVIQYHNCVDEGHSIGIRFSKDIIPYISGQMEPGTFCHYDTRMAKVGSSDRYKLYEYIQRNLWRVDTHGKLRLKVADMYEALGYTTAKKVVFGAFNRSVLTPCIADMQKILGLHLSVTLLKVGKNVVTIELTKENPNALV